PPKTATLLYALRFRAEALVGAAEAASLAPSAAKAGEGWGGVQLVSLRTVGTPSQPPLPSQGEGPNRELAASSAPTKHRGIRAAADRKYTRLHASRGKI